MFHAVGLNVMDSSEMYNDVAEVSTMDENVSMIPTPKLMRMRTKTSSEKSVLHVIPTSIYSWEVSPVEMDTPVMPAWVFTAVL